TAIITNIEIIIIRIIVYFTINSNALYIDTIVLSKKLFSVSEIFRFLSKITPFSLSKLTFE
ncbi:hypothetical protein, partial [Bacillus cereus]|uniref:hypothetical protein n=1 Tax=Bacillus cereus TaxID=1396 RepID=UPI001C54EACB